MLSRIAEHLYWIGRFVERAEDISRLVSSHLYSGIQAGSAEDGGASQELLAALGAPAETIREAAAWWVNGDKNPSSVVSCIRAARESARHAREVLSLEIWESLNGANDSLDRMLRRDASVDDIASAVPSWTLGYAGIVEATSLRDSSWAILRLGATLERAAMTLRALTIGAESREDWALDDPLTIHAWAVTLRACAALDSYRKTTIAIPSGRTVAELLLRASTCPRSVVSSLREAETHLPFGSEASRRVGLMRAELEYRPAAEVFVDLIGTLHRLMEECDGVHESIVGAWRGREETG